MTPSLTELCDMPVYDFFCPPETRACTPVLDYRAADACRSASISTVGTLAAKSADELRRGHFTEEVIGHIGQRLQAAHPQLQLRQTFSPAAAGAQGRAPAVSFLVAELPPASARGRYAAPFIQNYGA